MEQKELLHSELDDLMTHVDCSSKEWSISYRVGGDLRTILPEIIRVEEFCNIVVKALFSFIFSP